jgi:hypothetical protein
VIGGNALNWGFTCTACGGFASGATWFDQFWAAYAALFGAPPPADGWGVHVYIVSWDRLPMADLGLATAQITGFRSYLDLKGQAAAPIWVTETGVIWGYDGWTSTDILNPADPGFCDGATSAGCRTAPCRADSAVCVGARPSAYATPALSAYLAGILDWLLANADALRIERWFWYIQAPVPEPYAATFGGVALMDSAGPGARLTPFGQIFSQRSE